MASSVGEGRGAPVEFCMGGTAGEITGETAGELEITATGWDMGFCDKNTPVTKRTIPAAAVAKVRGLSHAAKLCHHGGVAGASSTPPLITPSAASCARKEIHKRSGGFASAGSSWASD